MSEITKAERDTLFEDVYFSLGGGVSELIEFDNKSFDVFLRMSIQDYSSFINNWLVENQFPYIQNLHVDSADITLALTTKSLDFETSFAASYSKQFGIGNTVYSSWELKKDFITVSAGTQVYTIEAGREINEILWCTPPNILSSNHHGLNGNWNFGPTGWVVDGIGGMNALLPSYNLMLASQDREQKRKLLQSDLTYRVAPGPAGTKLLFLYPIPGSNGQHTHFGNHYDGTRVYYFYYETNSRGRKKCLEENNDIIKTPNDVPINKLKYTQLNDNSKLRVRELLVIKFLEYLSINRGKYSGELPGVNGKSLKLDYEFLQDRADKEKERVYGLIEASLQKLSYSELMKQRAEIAENLNTVLKYQASRVQYLIT